VEPLIGSAWSMVSTQERKNSFAQVTFGMGLR
jgi:hypothetical protein